MKKYIVFISISFFILSSCSKSGDTNASLVSNGIGLAGSTARFAIIGNYLYTVDHQNLNVFDIKNSNKPNKISSTNIGFDIETIFPRDEKTIFIGSQNGMHIYDVTNPLLISQTALITHFRACDPVVANKNYAFVTLNSEGSFSTRNCWGSINQLITYDISNLSNPITMSVYNLNKPKGLGLLGNNLFVCDNLLRWYDATNPSNLVSKKNYTITAHDIIPLDSSLILVGADGITQLGFVNDSIWHISKIQTNAQ